MSEHDGLRQSCVKSWSIESIRVGQVDDGLGRIVQVGFAVGFFGPFLSGMAGCRGRGFGERESVC